MGKPLVLELINLNIYSVFLIALDKIDFPQSVTQIVVDRRNIKFNDQVQIFTKQVLCWDAVIDICAFDRDSSAKIYSLLKDHCKHFITLSTTLVYDRSNEISCPIAESEPLASENILGGYVDGKLGIEKHWREVNDVNWTILRPYHILGEGSLLGCIPEHNRDPNLIECIRRGGILYLCNGGNINFNYIHPNDIATAIVKVIGNERTYRQTYNLVNPVIIKARDYYEKIAKQLGLGLKIEDISFKQVWTEMKGWELTTLPHVYSMDKFFRDTSFMPSTQLDDGIRDAMKNYPTTVDKIQDTLISKRMNKPPKPKLIKWILS